MGRVQVIGQAGDREIGEATKFQVSVEQLVGRGNFFPPKDGITASFFSVREKNLQSLQVLLIRWEKLAS